MKKVLIALIVLASSCNQPDNNYNNSVSNSVLSSKKVVKDDAEIKAEVEKVEKEYNVGKMPKTFDECKKQMNELSDDWKYYFQDIEDNSKPSILAYKHRIGKSLGNFQSKAFPIYRKFFTKELNEKLWIDDCGAWVSGGRNEILNLWGHSFALHKVY